MNDEVNPNNQLPVGYQLGAFTIEAVLGCGGFGITYKARDKHLDRLVAIKEYFPFNASRLANYSVVAKDEESRSIFDWGLTRFRDEARTMAKFKHLNIVAVTQLEELNSTVYIVMEYEHGQNLKQYLESLSEAPTESWLVNELILPLLDGLTHMHAKAIFHRDIKPENIYIRADNTPILLDFGSARPGLPDQTCHMTTVITVGYSPMEQYSETGKQGPWTDLYALAGTLYYAITNQKPPAALDRLQGDHYKPIAEIAQGQYSPILLSAIDWAMELQPCQRPQNAQEMRQALITQQVAPQTVSHAVNTKTQHPRQITSTTDTVIQSARVQDQTQPSAPVSKRNLPQKLGVAITVFGVAIAAWLVLNLQQSDPVIHTSQTIATATPTPTEVTTPEVTTPEVTTPEVTLSNQKLTTTEATPPSLPEPTPEALLQDAFTTANQNLLQHRKTQLTGTILSFISHKSNFQQCIESKCQQLLTLKQELDQARLSQWKKSPFQGTLHVSGNSTDLVSCPWRVEVQETLSDNKQRYQQTRHYCTSNGLDRQLQEASSIQQQSL